MNLIICETRFITGYNIELSRNQIHFSKFGHAHITREIEIRIGKSNATRMRICEPIQILNSNRHKHTKRNV